MEVRATKAGFYGTRRRPGAKFELTDKKHFSANWMEPTEVKAEVKGKGPVDPKSMV